LDREAAVVTCNFSHPSYTYLHTKNHQLLWEDLCWLNDAVYVHVKHNYAMRHSPEPGEVEEERKGHLFSVEEAIAIYIIARYLAVGITGVI
jgi:hypothetical protein